MRGHPSCLEYTKKNTSNSVEEPDTVAQANELCLRIERSYAPPPTYGLIPSPFDLWSLKNPLLFTLTALWKGLTYKSLSDTLHLLGLGAIFPCKATFHAKIDEIQTAANAIVEDSLRRAYDLITEPTVLGYDVLGPMREIANSV